jgi:hypothetical protein
MREVDLQRLQHIQTFNSQFGGTHRIRHVRIWMDLRAAGCRPYGTVKDSFVGAASCRPSLTDVKFSSYELKIQTY